MAHKSRSFLPEALASQVYGNRPLSYARVNRRTYGTRLPTVVDAAVATPAAPVSPPVARAEAAPEALRAAA